MDKITLLNDLEYVQYEYGRYSGKWVNCNNRLALAEEMFEYMENKAVDYDIKLKKELEDNFDKEEYDELMGFGMEYVYDDLIYRLYNTITEKIMEMIL